MQVNKTTVLIYVHTVSNTKYAVFLKQSFRYDLFNRVKTQMFI